MSSVTFIVRNYYSILCILIIAVCVPVTFFAYRKKTSGGNLLFITNLLVVIFGLFSFYYLISYDPNILKKLSTVDKVDLKTVEEDIEELDNALEYKSKQPLRKRSFFSKDKGVDLYNEKLLAEAQKRFNNLEKRYTNYDQEVLQEIIDTFYFKTDLK